MSKSKIYTRTGDTGETSLFGGRRVSKGSRVIEVLGSLDELNAIIGVVLAEQLPQFVRIELGRIQNDLFTIGSRVAGYPGQQEKEQQYFKVRIEELEKSIDFMEEKLPALSNFILPGGTRSGALSHQARAVARRAERAAVLNGSRQNLSYLNRLSDYFFVLARFLNFSLGVEETIWKETD